MWKFYCDEIYRSAPFDVSTKTKHRTVATYYGYDLRLELEIRGIINERINTETETDFDIDIIYKEKRNVSVVDK